MLLQERLVEYDLLQAGTVPNHRVLSKPSVSHSPIFPVSKYVFGFSLALGLFSSFVFLTIKYLAFNTIESLEDVEKNLDLPLLGMVPDYKKEKMPFSKLVVDQNPKSSITESLRGIRTNLDFIASEEKCKVISVTSTLSGEGKTFVALNIAGIIAMSGKKVVLVDLDMRKPKIHLAFGKENMVGASSVLIGADTLENVIQPYSSHLDFMASGPPPPNPAELIVSPSFAKLQSDLMERYDVVIFDTPPVGLVTDGLLVMKNVTNPIFVLRAHVSKFSYLKGIQKLTEMNEIKNLSVVLNSVGARRAYGYGQGYGYGYGYGYGASYGYGYYEENKK